VVLGGADAELFVGHERSDGVVGLSSAFYERKNPDRLLELMRLLPHRRFHLIGRKWEQYVLFGAMRALPNFSYLTIPYREYPEQYRKFDVFLSMSTLEGGPIPLLEAMMCNAVPVASDTGFAPDLIRHGENGFLFDIDAPATTIAWQIEAAFQLDCDVRSTVLSYDWHNFSKTIVGLGA
jgi:glycosyltransferase involved in cell wall biosynthesis